MPKIEWGTMDFRHQKQELLERAKRVEEKAFCEKNTQAKGIMRALAALYGEMAEELDDSGCSNAVFFPWTLLISPVAINQLAPRAIAPAWWCLTRCNQRQLPMACFFFAAISGMSHL